MLGRGGSRVAVQPQAAGASDHGVERGGEMKYYSLSCRELQALCKEYQIPANNSNVAMAQALAAFHNTVGPTPAAKLLTVGRLSTVTIPSEGSVARLKSVEKKPSSRIVSLATRSDRDVVERSEANAKKLPAKSSKKLIPGISVLNISTNASAIYRRQTFEASQTDPTSSQPGTTRQTVTRKPQTLKISPRNVNGLQRVSKETRIELLPSISPMEKSKMGRSQPVLKKRETCKETAEKRTHAVYKPSGKENNARDGKTKQRKSSLQNKEAAHSVQKSLQPSEMNRNGTILSFNTFVKSIPQTSAADVKLAFSDCDSGAVEAQDDSEEASIVVIQESTVVLEEESFPVIVEQYIGDRSFCVYESHPEVVLKKPCNNKKAPSSVPVNATQLFEPKVEDARVAPTIAQTTAEACVQSLCLEKLGNKEESAAVCKEYEAEFVSAPFSPKKIESTKRENSSSVSMPNSAIDYILLPPRSPPEIAVEQQQQPVCCGHSKRLAVIQKTGAATSKENVSAVGERPSGKDDYLMRRLHKLPTSIRDKVIWKEKS